ncbi:MAG: pyrophosphohydrolase [Parcubacteria bacterium C7867-001]|nr:MAG: pyrophosphohydrolase [Parcubacteria bacterium C7867-001]
MIFDTEPADFSARMQVVGCYVEHAGRILLLRRHEKKPEGGTWCVPGGKIDAGEAVLEAAIRETEEETGYRIPPELITEHEMVFVRYPTVDFTYKLFHAKLDERPHIILRPNEHTDFRWVLPHDALTFALIEDEGACIRRIFKI